MRKIWGFIAIVMVAFYSCESEQATVEVPFGIEYSDYSTSDKAGGFIMYQNYGGPRIDLVVDSAYIKDLDTASAYQLKYLFSNVDGEISDSLQVFIRKLTSDQNFHSETDSSQNKILFAVFNADTLELDTSALQVAPVYSTQTFHTVLNLYTSNNKGTFNGTVDSIPLIKSII
jgi:hypothetical protein